MLSKLTNGVVLSQLRTLLKPVVEQRGQVGLKRTM
jgi:hypothetical protein